MLGKQELQNVIGGAFSATMLNAIIGIFFTWKKE